MPWLSSAALAALTAAADRDREHFERTVAVLREENSTLRRMLEAAQRRQDELLGELVKSLATTAAPARQPLASAPPKRTSRDPIDGLGNVLDPVPYDHAMASFTSERAASLMGAEDEDTDGVSAAA